MKKPSVHTSYLENGIRIVRVPLDFETINVFFIFNVGNQNIDLSTEAGYPHFLEHLLFKGTSRIGAIKSDEEAEYRKKINAILSEIGPKMPIERIHELRLKAYELEKQSYRTYNDLEYTMITHFMNPEDFGNAYTYMELTSYFNNVRPEYFEDFMRLSYERFSDFVVRSFIAEQNVVLQEMFYEDPVQDTVRSFLFHGHYLSASIIGNRDTILRATPERLYELFRTHYTADHLTILIAGNVTEAHTGIIKKVFADYRRNFVQDKSYTEPVIKNKGAHIYYETNYPILVFAARKKTNSIKSKIISYIVNQLNLNNPLSYAFEMPVDFHMQCYRDYVTFTCTFSSTGKKIMDLYSDVERRVRYVLRSDAVRQWIEKNYENALANMNFYLRDAFYDKYSNEDFITHFLFNKGISPADYDKVYEVFDKVKIDDIVEYLYVLASLADSLYLMFSEDGRQDYVNNGKVPLVSLNNGMVVKTSRISEYSRKYINNLIYRQENNEVEDVRKIFTGKHTFVKSGGVWIPSRIYKSYETGHIVSILPVKNVRYEDFYAIKNFVENISYSYTNRVNIWPKDYGTALVVEIPSVIECLDDDLELMSDLLLHLYGASSKAKKYIGNVRHSMLLHHKDISTNVDISYSAHAWYFFFENWKKLIWSNRRVTPRQLQNLLLYILNNRFNYLSFMHEDVLYKKLYRKLTDYISDGDIDDNVFTEWKVRKMSVAEHYHVQVDSGDDYSIFAVCYNLGRVSPTKLGMAHVFLSYANDMSFGVLTKIIRHTLGLTYDVSMHLYNLEGYMFIVLKLITSNDNLNELNNSYDKIVNDAFRMIDDTAFSFIKHLDYKYNARIPGSDRYSAINHYDMLMNDVNYSSWYYWYKMREIVRYSDLKDFIERYILHDNYLKLTVSNKSLRLK